jgi:hypothetical protein
MVEFKEFDAVYKQVLAQVPDEHMHEDVYQMLINLRHTSYRRVHIAFYHLREVETALNLPLTSPPEGWNPKEWQVTPCGCFTGKDC